MTSDPQHDMRIIHQFSRWAQAFADLPIHAEEEAMAQTMAAAGIGPRDTVLDVACGPGIVACVAARTARHVTGIDLTPAMIEQARARQAATGLGNVDWRIADATALPFEDGSFDVVMTRYSFHHLPDPAAALAEMRRVCRPGGRIAVIDATPSADCQAAYDRMETLRDPSHTSALTLDQLRALGLDAGLDEQVIDGYRIEAVLATLADTGDLPALEAMFDADISNGQDTIGVGAWRADDGIHFYFPVSILAWTR